MLSQYPPLFFRAVDIFADLCDDNHHEGQIKYLKYLTNVAIIREMNVNRRK